MPNPTGTTPPRIIADPGFLYWAPLGTALPTNTVTGSVFTDAWTAPWTFLGYTDAGSDWHYNQTDSPIDVAELYDPVVHRITARMGSVTFSLASYTATNLALAMNGAVKTVTGTTGTTLTALTPVQPGQETRFMLGWESTTADVRKIAFQVLNTGDIADSMKKAPAKALIPFNCMFEMPPSSVVPYQPFFAGVARG